MSVVVDAETQTESMDISETDLSPATSCPTTSCASTTVYPQRVILQEFQGSTKDEGTNGNSVTLHYMIPHPEPGSLFIFTNVNVLNNYLL